MLGEEAASQETLSPEEMDRLQQSIERLASGPTFGAVESAPRTTPRAAAPRADRRGGVVAGPRVSQARTGPRTTDPRADARVVVIPSRATEPITSPTAAPTPARAWLPVAIALGASALAVAALTWALLRTPPGVSAAAGAPTIGVAASERPVDPGAPLVTPSTSASISVVPIGTSAEPPPPVTASGAASTPPATPLRAPPPRTAPPPPATPPPTPPPARPCSGLDCF
jgi:hypothetical protein